MHAEKMGILDDTSFTYDCPQLRLARNVEPLTAKPCRAKPRLPWPSFVVAAAMRETYNRIALILATARLLCRRRDNAAPL